MIDILINVGALIALIGLALLNKDRIMGREPSTAEPVEQESKKLNA